MRTKGHAMDTICYEVGCDLCCNRNSKNKDNKKLNQENNEEIDNNSIQDDNIISRGYLTDQEMFDNYKTLSIDTDNSYDYKADQSASDDLDLNDTNLNSSPIPSPSSKANKCKDCRCKDRIKLSKCDEFYDKYLKMLSEYQKNPTQAMLKRLNRLQIKISKCRRVSIICEKVSNELGKKCKSKICYINCERYYKEYMQSLKKFRKKDNNRTRRELYNNYVRLDKCRRARIESSVGPDGWGSTPAQPTMDHLIGHGINYR